VNATALRSAEDWDTIMLVETWFDRENFMSEQLKRPYREKVRSMSAGASSCASRVSFYEPLRSLPK
jgi:quinol monooxygenase YgiN